MRLWQSAAERAGAVDDVFGVGGADRLRDANCVSSRNIELLNGQSFSHGTFDGQQTRTVAVAHEDAETRRRPVRERHVPSRRRPIRNNSNQTP